MKQIAENENKTDQTNAMERLAFLYGKRAFTMPHEKRISDDILYGMARVIGQSGVDLDEAATMVKLIKETFDTQMIWDWLPLKYKDRMGVFLDSLHELFFDLFTTSEAEGVLISASLDACGFGFFPAEKRAGIFKSMESAYNSAIKEPLPVDLQDEDLSNEEAISRLKKNLSKSVKSFLSKAA